MQALRLFNSSRQVTFQAIRYYSKPPLDTTNWSKDRKKLLYVAKQRGMKETCILIGQYAEEKLGSMNDEQIKQFTALLDEIDPKLNQWITGVEPFPEDIDGEVAQDMKAFAQQNPLKYKVVW